MIKNVLGHLVRKQRKALALTQRQLANQVGVQPSHLAYIERGLRNPSISVLGRMAEALGIDGAKLFFLLYPQAKVLLGTALASKRPKPFDESWRQFVGDRALLRQHAVTRAELKILKQVGLLRRVSSSRQFLFILNAMRQAGEED
jgi:transcriptional regulator with XRE-family HTH domain